MEAVALARSNTVVNRNDTRRFIAKVQDCSKETAGKSDSRGVVFPGTQLTGLPAEKLKGESIDSSEQQNRAKEARMSIVQPLS